MTKRSDDYKLLVERVSNALEHTPEQLARWVELSENYIQAASDMTKDELALIEAYLKRDLHTFGEQYKESQQDETDTEIFRTLIANSLWEKLADITDKTQLEWREVLRDIEHHGVYHAGEVVGLGILECEQCGHKTEHYHVEILSACSKCGGKAFNRQSL